MSGIWSKVSASYAPSLGQSTPADSALKNLANFFKKNRNLILEVFSFISNDKKSSWEQTPVKTIHRVSFILA